MSRHEFHVQIDCGAEADAAQRSRRYASPAIAESLSTDRIASTGRTLAGARRAALAVVVAVFGLSAGWAHADTPDSWGQAGFLNQFEADTDDDGRFDMRGGFVRGQFVVRLADDVHVRMLGSYHGVAYEFDDPPTIQGTEFKPWNTVHVARLNPLVGIEIDDRINLFVGPLVEASLENGGDFAKSIKLGGLIAAEMQVHENLKVGLGILGVSEIESGFYLQPVLQLDWTPIERLTIHASSWTTRGGRFEISYEVSDEFEIASSVSYRRERFRLKERTLTTTPPPPTFRTGSKGTGEDRAVIPAVRVSYSPKSRLIFDTVGAIRIDLEAGVALAGDLKLESRTGGSLQTIGYDPAPVLQFTVSIPL